MMSGLGIMWGPASSETVLAGALGLAIIAGGVFYLCRRIKRNVNK